MLRNISGLIRKLVAKVEGAGRASANLREDLQTYIREDFLTEMKYDKLIYKLRTDISKVSPVMDIESIYDVFVDRFIDEERTWHLVKGPLTRKLVEEGLSSSEALNVISPRFSRGLSDREREVLDKYTEKEIGPGKLNPHYGEIGKMINTNIQRVFTIYVYNWKKDKEKKEEKETGFSRDLPQTFDPKDELDREKADAEQAKKEYSWETPLMKETMAYIEEHAPKGDVELYKKILEYRSNLERSKKEKKVPFRELGKEFGVSADKAEGAWKKLKEMLTNFFRSNPELVKSRPRILKDDKLINEEGEEVEVPKYQVFMKDNTDKQESLYKWLRWKFGDGRAPSETTLETLKYLSEGLSVDEITEKKLKDQDEEDAKIKSKIKNTITKIKNRNFDKEYKEWYEEYEMNKKVAFYRLMCSSFGIALDYDLI